MSITGITETTPSALGVEKEQPQILRRSAPQDDSAGNCLFLSTPPRILRNLCNLRTLKINNLCRINGGFCRALIQNPQNSLTNFRLGTAGDGSYALSPTPYTLFFVTLLINADDFGLTPGVNRSIAELHQGRALCSATLMATGTFFDDAVAVAKANPALEVGCHVLLVDGMPALPASQIRSLCPDGQGFRSQLGRFAADLYAGRIRDGEIEAEATAQIRRLQTAGLRVSHIDTHKHTHLFPRVLRPLLRAARGCGIGAIRNPFEPAWALRATPRSGRLRRLAVVVLGSQRRAFLRFVQASGMSTTDGTIGVLATGTLDVETTLHGLLAAMPPTGAWELVCHPGYPDTHLDQVRTRLRASRAAEHAALLQLIPRSGVALGSWSSLATLS
jgi:predicted glycoside hydrolase/deacetylase ChbG (UPF0249 family)